MKEKYIQLLKHGRWDMLAIGVFLLISFVYFMPAVIEGRVIAQHDNIAFIGAGQEVVDYRNQTGETSRWTNSLFGGMPTYQTSPSYNSNAIMKSIEKVYQLFLPNYVFLLFIMLTGFYILMRVLKTPVLLSILGAIMWSFSSYFFIIITAGHIWKFITLAYIPPTIAGMLLVYDKKYLIGSILVILFFALQIMSNHIQMTYYFLFVMLFLAIAYGISYIKKGQGVEFIKASFVLLFSFALGACINISNLYHTYEYSKDTMRGKSELVKAEKANEQTSSGLDRDYITQWSYGIDETLTLMIPNTKGGASVPLAINQKAMQKADSRFYDLYKQIPQYWGNQPGTSGPVYVGAFVCTLFILGCFLVRGAIKWALVAATVFSILLSWGKNFMGLTDLFIDYVPMYAKFRTVASILVVAEFSIPLLAILTIKEIIQQPNILKEKATYCYISLALTAGTCLLMALLPTLFFSSFISDSLLDAIRTNIPMEIQPSLIQNLTDINAHIFSADAWRSFWIILVGTVVVALFSKHKIKATHMVSALVVLILVDMWGINKRYLNDTHFEPKQNKFKAIEKTSTDEIILQDPSPNYRVLNFASNTFNENNTSYWHKSIGGYHAAKLRRYQEMIEYYISPEMQNIIQYIQEHGSIEGIDEDAIKVINMLNTKYFIFPTQEGTVPIANPQHYGNAWFVNRIKYVNSANEEIEAIKNTDLRQEAVINQKYASSIGHGTKQEDSTAHISLVSYAPNKLVYTSTSQHEQVAVFSEIYYKQWRAFIDGQEVPIACADYILRSIKVPGGTHTIEFIFEPTSIAVTEGIAYGAITLMFLLFIGVLYRQYKKNTFI